MTPQFTPRVQLDAMHHKGVTFGISSEAAQIRKSLDMIRGEPGKLAQTRYSSLALAYRELGLGLYIVGFPLSQVRDAFAGLALAGLKVAELRGTEEPFLKTVVTIDSRYPQGDPRHASLAPADLAGARDFSLGSASLNFLYVTAALVAGEFELARRIAALAGDPPDFESAETPSEHSTPNDRRIAYAVRDMFAGRRDEALAALNRVRATNRGGISADYLNLAKMIHALVVSEADLFIEGVEGLLPWNEQAIRKDPVDLDLYLSLPATGLTALALHQGLILRGQLPQDHSCLPLDLIDFALAQTRDVADVDFVIFDDLVKES